MDSSLVPNAMRHKILLSNFWDFGNFDLVNINRRSLQILPIALMMTILS